MLATAATELPRGGGWAYEFKWDGVRALLDVTDAGVRLHSRNGNDITGGYPELVAMADSVGDALVDGEIVAFVDGRPSFERLQSRMHVRGRANVARAAETAQVTFVAFDLLRRFGLELTDRPYSERRATLERFVAEHEGWTLSPSFDDGPATEQVARGHGLEGVVAKRVDSPYRPGVRTRDWLKLRFVRSGDFVILGWEAAPEHPRTLSSLILGFTAADGTLRFAGRVGSGLAGRVASRVQGGLRARTDSAVPDVPPSTGHRVMHWVEPEVVVEVEFVAWTGDGRLRHPVFRGLRPDKSVHEAVGDGAIGDEAGGGAGDGGEE